MRDRVPFLPVGMPKSKHPRADELDGLCRAAREAAKHAHAPYSGFSVGAVLQDDRGRRFAGANIENAAYPLGICAERVALQIWLQQGGSRIVRAVVYTDTPEATPPCGLCREALGRWAADAEVFLAHRGGVSGPHRPGSWLPGRARASGSHPNGLEPPRRPEPA